MPLLTDAPTARALFAAPRGLMSPLLPELERAFFTGLGATISPWRDEPALGEWLLVREHARESQFVRMQELLAAGVKLPDRLLVVALRGDRFVGQRGRGWSALPGNLHLSAHYHLDLVAGSLQVPLSLWPAVATARAIEVASEGALRPGTKWVNDLLLTGRKVAGVLVHSSVRHGQVGSVLLGIGVNVAQAPELPAGKRLLQPAALAEFDARFAAPDAWAQLLQALLVELERARQELLSDAPSTLFEAYRDRAMFINRRVHIWPVSEDEQLPALASGRVLGLESDLSLRLEGVTEPVRFGRMTIDPEP